MTNAALLLRGTSASAGLARGPVHLLDVTAEARTGSGSGAALNATQDLRDALSRASSELLHLQSTVADAEAMEILDFQLAMLDDETLSAPAFDAIAGGAAPDVAWAAAMDAQIADYAAADDAYFRARASDLRDIRDRVLRGLSGNTLAAVPAGAIVVASDLPPSRFLEIGWQGGGIALFAGSSNSHVATLARARGVPMIVQMTPATLAPDADVLLDAENGVLITSPDPESLRTFGDRQRAAVLAAANDRTFLAGPALTAAGERVKVLLNVAARSDLDAVSPEHCDGIGLVRTELMLRTLGDLRDEERQFAAYREIVTWAHGLPVTFRTIDAGGDKPIEGYTLAGEANPFLGVRGIRLSLRQPDILLTQLRALARAAALGPLKVMLPMITLPAEFARARDVLAAALQQLRDASIACAAPQLGMMVEVPAAALTLDLFDADFFSIGSNDLVAYLTASSRDSDQRAPLADPLQPAVVRLLATIVAQARVRGLDVSLCGDMASDERCLPALLQAGLRGMSVAPPALARVKAAIARFGKGNAADG